MGLRDLFSGGDDRPRRLLPSDAPATLESFGLLNGPAPGGDAVGGQLVQKGLQSDPDRTLDELVEACDSVGGWSYYGAWDILSAFAPDRQDDPRYVHIVDGLLDDLTAKGYGPGDIPMILVPRAIARQRATRAAAHSVEQIAIHCSPTSATDGKVTGTMRAPSASNAEIAPRSIADTSGELLANT